MTGFDDLERQLLERVAERRRPRRRRSLAAARPRRRRSLSAARPLRALNRSPLGALLGACALAGLAAAAITLMSATGETSIAARAFAATTTSGRLVHYVEVASYSPPPGMGLRQVKRRAAVWVSGGRSRVIETVTLIFLDGRHTTVQHISSAGTGGEGAEAVPAGGGSAPAPHPMPATPALPAASCIDSGACTPAAATPISALRALYLKGKLNDSGETVSEGRRLDVLTSKEGPPMRILVDPQSFLPVEVLTSYRSAGSGTMLASTTIEDYRQLPLTPSATGMLAPRCHSWQLAARLGSRTSLRSGFRRIVTFRNGSGAACTLYGYPGMRMLSAGGASLATHVHRGASTTIDAVPEQIVALSPGGEASFAAGYLHGGLTSSPNGGLVHAQCPAAAEVEITPPNAYRHITIRWALRPFGGASGPRCGAVSVSPVYSGAGAPPAPAPSAAPETASATVGRCHASELAARLGAGGAATGHVGQVITFVNASETACSLRGYPGLQLLGAHHRRLQTHVDRGASYIIPSMPVRRVLLQPGSEASFEAGYEDGTGFSDISCPAARAVLVTPPNAYRPLKLRWAPRPYGGPRHSLHGCGEVTVSPVYAGLGRPRGV